MTTAIPRPSCPSTRRCGPRPGPCRDRRRAGGTRQPSKPSAETISNNDFANRSGLPINNTVSRPAHTRSTARSSSATVRAGGGPPAFDPLGDRRRVIPQRLADLAERHVLALHRQHVHELSCVIMSSGPSSESVDAWSLDRLEGPTTPRDGCQEEHPHQAPRRSVIADRDFQRSLTH
jgi:hypothetical protein